MDAVRAILNSSPPKQKKAKLELVGKPLNIFSKTDSVSNEKIKEKTITMNRETTSASKAGASDPKTFNNNVKKLLLKQARAKKTKDSGADLEDPFSANALTALNSIRDQLSAINSKESNLKMQPIDDRENLDEKQNKRKSKKEVLIFINLF